MTPNALVNGGLSCTHFYVARRPAARPFDLELGINYFGGGSEPWSNCSTP